MADDYTYQLGYIRSRIRTLLNEPTASHWTDAELNNCINDAMRYIAEQAACVCTIDDANTEAGSRAVAFTGHRIEAAEYVSASGVPTSLKKITPQQVGHVPCAGKHPQYWYELGQYIGIEPRPNAIYHLHLYIVDYPADLASDSAVPGIPLAYRPLIALLATSTAMIKEQRYYPAKFLMSVFWTQLNYLIGKYTRQMPDATADMILK